MMQNMDEEDREDEGERKKKERRNLGFKNSTEKRRASKDGVLFCRQRRRI